MNKTYFIKTICVFLGVTFLHACNQSEQKVETPPTIVSTIDKKCVPDKYAYLRLDVRTFEDDQEKGWRKVAHTEGCMSSAASLINEYRERIAQDMSGLTWHEAQLRASTGETKQAIFLFKQTHTYKESEFSNIHYRDATIAFLEQDKSALLVARAKLSNLPEPKDFAASIERFRKQYPKSDPPTWPPNLNIVDSFIACFDKPYKEAYSRACQQ